MSGLKPIPINDAHLSFNGVAVDLRDFNGNWNVTLLNQIFNHETINKILAVHWIDSQRSDDFVWTPSRNSNFFC